MELNLLPILNCDGKKMPIDVKLSIPEGTEDNFKALSDIEVVGEIVNIGGRLELTAEGRTKIERVCDRCLETYVVDYTFPIEEMMKKADGQEQENENVDISYIDGNSIDLTEIVCTALYVNLPSKALCNEECKGLCSVCGKNLNNGECSCEKEQTDPRFDILDQLL